MDVEAECAEGYRDGRDTEALPPGPNRSPFYRHGFEVGRAEKQGQPIAAQVSRLRWDALVGFHASEAKP